MNHPERTQCRRFDTPLRSHEYTAAVYGGTSARREDLAESLAAREPAPLELNTYFGELHGHTALSDGLGTVDDYYKTARDSAGLDFCALTDHDHGGVGSPELWGDKWTLLREKAAQYHEEHHFVTLLGYERDSYPWYNNLVLYYRGGDGEMVRGVHDGEITRAELAALLRRDDILAVPHTGPFLHSGCDFTQLPPDLFCPLMEVYSRWGTSEYFGNPDPERIETRGGFWRDALEAGARMGCIAGSDDHTGTPGLEIPTPTGHPNLRYGHPGMVAVLAPELTRAAVFDALRSRRCYATSGGRIRLDFRVNGALMGSELTLPADAVREIWFRAESPAAPLKTLTLVCNGREELVYHLDGECAAYGELVYDYRPQRPTDYYYLRAELTDGHRAWSSPVWVTTG